MNAQDRQIKKILDNCETYADFKSAMNDIFYDPIIRVVKGWGKETERIVKYDVHNTMGYIFGDVWFEE